MLVLAGIAAVFIVRYAVLRPWPQLTEQVRAVAAGDFDHRLKVERPAELAELSGHVDAMRRRIVSEWRRASEAQAELEEQAASCGAPTASWSSSPTWPATTCRSRCARWPASRQMLEQRYGDQLDDRAKQYIAFAVDGAKRMQLLINDLLDFSRVGRVGGERTR